MLRDDGWLISADKIGSISRYFYMTGYCSGKEGGKGRYNGASFYLFQYGLVGLTIWSGVTMVMGM